MNRQETIRDIDAQLKRLRRRKKITSAIRSVFEVLSLSLIILIVFTFFLGMARVNQNSMLPNFQPNDIVFYNRLDNDYQRGDVIVAKEVNDNILIIKRIIAVGGDTIEIDENGTVFLNGEAIEETYVQGTTILRDVTYPLTLAEGEYFVMGDNREISLDSRSSHIGLIQEENIRGVVFYTLKLFR